MNKKGFTLLEMLVVVLIIGIISAIALPQYNRVKERAHFARAQVMAKSLYNSCDRLLIEFGIGYKDLSAAEKKISRLDIGKDSLLPAGFAIVDDSSITGAGFSYTLDQTQEECVVNITRISDSSTQLIYDGETFTCTDNGTSGMCELYGLD